MIGEVEEARVRRTQLVEPWRTQRKSLLTTEQAEPISLTHYDMGRMWVFLQYAPFLSPRLLVCGLYQLPARVLLGTEPQAAAAPPHYPVFLLPPATASHRRHQGKARSAKGDMALYRRLLLLRCLSYLHPSPFSAPATGSAPPPTLAGLLTPLGGRHFAFSTAEEAAAERRRKRRLRIEPPINAVRRGPPPPRDPNAPRLPDTTSALVGPRLSLHNRVQSLIRSGDLDGASVAARAAVSSRVRPTVFTCNAVTAAMVRAGRHDDVVALFEFFFRHSNIVPNIVSYNTLILAHCEAARVDDAMQVYHGMLGSTPFSPSAVNYRHLTKGLDVAGGIRDALDLLREMLNRGAGADSLVYNNLITGYIDLDDWGRAFELFNELTERCLVYDGVVHTTFMEGYWKQGKDKEAMDKYQSLL
ncbi:Pentatricopeptide repeat-containing protein [Dichanthelium oligosanthes]|uniref:Pentatricopeptide repeat-containing protein n=1 Tax=Dichanthelium oligosanthes TaxID=888268 RepID=A0A1E5VJA7_9POAL|nr:Pentatricopeptide repeat-containing protein [Dichanthelium oligosanthes]